MRFAEIARSSIRRKKEHFIAEFYLDNKFKKTKRGLSSFSLAPRTNAETLKKDNAVGYSHHSFRRARATFLHSAGVSMTIIIHSDFRV